MTSDWDWTKFPPMVLSKILNKLLLEEIKVCRQVTSNWTKMVDTSNHVTFNANLSDSTATLLNNLSNDIILKNLYVQSFTSTYLWDKNIPKFRCCTFGPNNSDGNIWTILKMCEENGIEGLEFEENCFPNTIPLEQMPLNLTSLTNLVIRLRVPIGVEVNVVDGSFNQEEGLSVGVSTGNEMFRSFLRFIQYVRFGVLENVVLGLDLKQTQNVDLSPLYEMLNHNQTTLKSVSAMIRIEQSQSLPPLEDMNLETLKILYDGDYALCVEPLLSLRGNRLRNLQIWDWQVSEHSSRYGSSVLCTLTAELVAAYADTLQSVSLILGRISYSQLKLHACQQVETLDVGMLYRFRHEYQQGRF